MENQKLFSIFLAFLLISLCSSHIAFSQYICTGGGIGSLPICRNVENSYNVTNITLFNVTNITNVSNYYNISQGIASIRSNNFSLIVENGTTTNISINSSFVQLRVNNGCLAGSSIRIINDDGTVVCETDSTGSGTVTSIVFQDGLYGGTISNSGSVGINYTELVLSVGNWSLDKSSYSTTTQASLLYDPFGRSYPNITSLQTSNSTIFSRLDDLAFNDSYINNSLNNLNITVQSLRTSNTSVYSFLNGLWLNASALQLSNSTIFNLFNTISNNVSYVNNSLNTLNLTVIGNVSNLNNFVNNLNTSKSGLGTVSCPTGTVMQNITLSSGVPTVQCVTDATSIGASSTPPAYYFGNYWQQCEFETVTSGQTQIWTPTAILSGTVALLPGSQNHPGIANISSSTTASSGYSIQISGVTTFVLSNNTQTEAIFRPTNASSATSSANFSTIIFGFQDVFTSSTNPVDGAYWNMTNNATGGVFNFTAYTVNNSVITASTTYQGAGTTDTNWYRAYIGIVNHTQANFTLYNSSNGQILFSYLINSTIPTTTGRETSHAFRGTAIGVTAVKGLAVIDYMNVVINRTLIR